MVYEEEIFYSYNLAHNEIKVKPLSRIRAGISKVENFKTGNRYLIIMLTRSAITFVLISTKYIFKLLFFVICYYDVLYILYTNMVTNNTSVSPSTTTLMDLTATQMIGKSSYLLCHRSKGYNKKGRL